MEPINWLHLRALALLALFGVFVMYALLAASWQSWHGKRRAPRMTKQDASAITSQGISGMKHKPGFRLWVAAARAALFAGSRG